MGDDIAVDDIAQLPAPLVDRAALDEIRIRYATAIDRRDWALFRSCFTADCVADYGPIGSWAGVEALAGWMEDVHQVFGLTLHRMTNLVSEVDGEQASGRCYVHVVLTLGDAPERAHESFGFYDDTFVRHGGGWLISRRVFTTVLSRDPA